MARTLGLSSPGSATCSGRSPVGCHRKPSRFHVARRLPAVAAPALAGLAVAVCVSPQAPVATPAAQAATQVTAMLTAAIAVPEAGLPLEQLLSAVRQAERHAPGAGQPAKYTVRPGDSLSVIAARFYHKTSAWPVLYYANRSQVRSADVLAAGQVLRIPAEPAAYPPHPRHPPPPPPRPRHPPRPLPARPPAEGPRRPAPGPRPSRPPRRPPAAATRAALSASAWSPASPAETPRS
jgi:LysM repeat protein